MKIPIQVELVIPPLIFGLLNVLNSNSSNLNSSDLLSNCQFGN